MRKQQILAQLPPVQVNVAASTAAMPLEVPALPSLPSLPTAAEIETKIAETSANVAEVAPPIGMMAAEAATPVLVGSHLAQKYVEGKHAFEMQQAEKAYESLEAQDRAKLPPFGNNEPLAPPPPLINPDRSEQGRKLTQPLTTPATPPNITTGTPPMSNNQPLPPPPPMITPMREQDKLSQVIMAKATNLPAWNKVTLDMTHIASGHVEGGHRAVQSGKKTLFPEGMTEAQISKTIETAYKNSKKVATNEEQQIITLIGEASGLKIKMYLDLKTNGLRAYPMEK